MGISNTAMSNGFIGTYAGEIDQQWYLVAYKDGTFYEFQERQGHYHKGTYVSLGENKYALTGEHISEQTVVSEKRSFSFAEGDTTVVFGKIDEIPMIPTAVEDLAE